MLDDYAVHPNFLYAYALTLEIAVLANMYNGARVYYLLRLISVETGNRTSWSRSKQDVAFLCYYFKNFECGLLYKVLVLPKTAFSKLEIKMLVNILPLLYYTKLFYSIVFLRVGPFTEYNAKLIRNIGMLLLLDLNGNVFRLISSNHSGCLISKFFGPCF